MKKNFFFFFCILIFFPVTAQEKIVLFPNERFREVQSFVKDKNYNKEIAFFINFKINSGQNRFFIVDIKNNKILEKGIVAHGSGSVIKDSEKLKFSNNEGSYQSSLGKYIIGSSYVGTFGKSYRLQGLDSSNNNAMKRAIVLHKLACVSDLPSKNLSCLSLGCPMVSPNFFKKVEKYIDSSSKPIILYAFY